MELTYLLLDLITNHGGHTGPQKMHAHTVICVQRQVRKTNVQDGGRSGRVYSFGEAD